MSQLFDADSAAQHEHFGVEGVSRDGSVVRDVSSASILLFGVRATGWGLWRRIMNSVAGVVGLAGVVQRVSPRRALLPHFAVVRFSRRMSREWLFLSL